MKSNTNLVTGHIIRDDNHEPVHGLSVQAWGFSSKPWVGDASCEICLGQDLTNRDGSFSISFHEKGLKKPIEGKLEVYLKIFDRDGRIIYDTREKTIPCDPEKRMVFELSLSPKILECHFSRPLSWQCPTDPLIPHEVIGEIEEALEMLAPPGSPDYARKLRAILMAEPSLIVFDRILRDAWDTLQGDLNAASRYRDILETICANRAGECCVDKTGPFAEFIEGIFKYDESGETCSASNASTCEEPDKEPCCPGKTSECEEPEKEPCCPCRESVITNEKAMTLTMATLHISCGHNETAKAYLSALLDQICRFHLLGALHRSAVKALCGDDRARSQFRDMIEYIGSICRPDNRDFEIHDPLPCCDTCLDEDLERCIRDAMCAWRSVSCYAVTDIKPQRACSGDRIVILGKGFGEIPGRIVFFEKGKCKLGAEVAAEKGCDEEIFWCDEKICVIVPDNAGCGLVPLLPADTVSVCDRFIEMHGTGCIQKGFEGTSPEILKFIVKDHSEYECIAPGEPLKIRWMTLCS